MTIEEKIQEKIDQQVKFVEKNSQSTFYVSDAGDRDYWNFRNQIVEALRNRGYNVSVSVNFGVTDIVTTKKLNLK